MGVLNSDFNNSFCYIVKTKLPAKFTVYRTRLWWVILFVICYVFVCAFMRTFGRTILCAILNKITQNCLCDSCYYSLGALVCTQFSFSYLMFKIETKIVFELYLKLILLIRLWWKWLWKYPFCCERVKKCEVV